jgi:hypothetical protein
VLSLRQVKVFLRETAKGSLVRISYSRNRRKVQSPAVLDSLRAVPADFRCGSAQSFRTCRLLQFSLLLRCAGTCVGEFSSLELSNQPARRSLDRRPGGQRSAPVSNSQQSAPAASLGQSSQPAQSGQQSSHPSSRRSSQRFTTPQPGTVYRSADRAGSSAAWRTFANPLHTSSPACARQLSFDSPATAAPSISGGLSAATQQSVFRSSPAAEQSGSGTSCWSVSSGGSSSHSSPLQRASTVAWQGKCSSSSWGPKKHGAEKKWDGQPGQGSTGTYKDACLQVEINMKFKNRQGSLSI